MMMHHKVLSFAVLASLGLCACNIDKLAAEFHVTEPPVDTTTADMSSSGEVGETSGSGGPMSTGSSGDASTSTGESTAQHTSEMGSSSGTPPAVCGDGVVGVDEECDDGNDDDLDDCDNSCARSWTIFVTSSSMFTGKLNGLKGADSRCANWAGNAGLARPLTYRALLSDSTMDVAERMHHARGWYRLVNGLPVAHGWDALMTEPLVNPVNVTEKSETSVVGVWTGTLPGGIAVPGAEDCSDWTDNSPLLKGHWGWSFEVDAGWLQSTNPDTNPTSCISPEALYCVEQP